MTFHFKEVNIKKEMVNICKVIIKISDKHKKDFENLFMYKFNLVTEQLETLEVCGHGIQDYVTEKHLVLKVETLNEFMRFLKMVDETNFISYKIIHDFLNPDLNYVKII